MGGDEFRPLKSILPLQVARLFENLFQSTHLFGLFEEESDRFFEILERLLPGSTTGRNVEFPRVRHEGSALLENLGGEFNFHTPSVVSMKKDYDNNWRRAMRSLIALTLFGGLAFAASAPVRELASQFPTGTLAHFRGGRLFQLGAMVRAYAPDGTRDFDAPILTPDGKVAPVLDIAVDPDHGFAVAASAGIALLNQRGIQTGFIETGEFLPLNLTIRRSFDLGLRN